MPPEPEAKSYHAILVRSRLVDPAALERVIQDLQRETGAHNVSGERLSNRLLQMGLISSWQDQKLRNGLFQGFFLGKYKLVRPLGSGGMAKVYLAEHVQMRRPVALKILPPALVDNASYLARFYQESRATAALDHPNIVRAFDIDKEGALHYLVMEYVEGEEVQKLVEKGGPLAPEVAARYTMQAAEGLAHAHDRGMIHRDIKPGNLLVDDTGKLKILDMGVARISGQSDAESLTLAHNEDVLGTVDYLAPEQVLDSHNVDPRADLYALGCTLYFMLVGHPPFPEGTMAVRLMKHQTEEPVSLLIRRPDLPKDLVDICRKMMAKKREKRFATAQDVVNDLKRWLNPEEGSPRAAPAPQLEAGGSGIGSGSGTGIPKGDQGVATLLARLATQGILTPYQIQVVSGLSDAPLAIDDYQILDRIPKGRLQGMFRARHRALHLPAVVSVVKLQGSPEQRQRQLSQFQHEARIWTQLEHPHVVRAYQMGHVGDDYYLCFENLAGSTLSELLQGGKKLGVLETCRIIRDAALGLGHLHQQDVIHRDLAPHNIWVTEARQGKVMGFALARDSLSHLDGTLVEPGEELQGSPGYAAPELAIDFHSATPAADLYSLGCILYQAATGKLPYEANDPDQLRMLHASASLTSPSKHRPELPQALDQLIVKLLSKTPGSRPRSAQRVVEMLEAVITAGEE